MFPVENRRPLGNHKLKFWASNVRSNRLQVDFPESHAAVSRHTVIKVEKTIGIVKAYLQLKAVTATKQITSAQAVRRMKGPKVAAASPPSCHAKTAANKRNTEKKNPNALKKSQYVRSN